MKNKLKTQKNIILFSIAILLFVFGAKTVDAATIYFSPSSGNFTVGNILTASVLLNTQGQSINNADAVINFPTELLDVISVSKSGSIFSLWVEEPAFSNSAGIITFNGGLPTPGFNGSVGKVISVVFRVKDSGTASLIFSSAAVRANDGFGTDILQTKNQAQYNLISEEKPSTPIKTTPSSDQSTNLSGPQAPTIYSETHPDEGLWYSSGIATFKWDVPSSVNAVQLLIGKIPKITPTVTYSPAINERTIEDLEDGEWYFHARFRDSRGWGATTHFKMNIDTVAPNLFTINVDNEGDSTNPTPLLKFKTTDEASGIDRYEITIDSNKSTTVEPEKVTSKGYKSPALTPGTHLVSITAFDRAGNFTTKTVNITVEPIRAPVITNYPERLTQGNQLIIEGVSLSDSKVLIGVRRKGEESRLNVVQTDEEGRWRYVHVQSLERGTYSVYAIAEDARGARSIESPAVIVEVTPPLFLEFGRIAIDYLTTMFILTILIVGVVLVIVYGWFMIIGWRRRLRKETEEAKDSVTESFRALNEELQEQFDFLQEAKKKLGLTKAEKRILEHLREDLKVAERFIKKEIRDIKKEIE